MAEKIFGERRIGKASGNGICKDSTCSCNYVLLTAVGPTPTVVITSSRIVTGEVGAWGSRFASFYIGIRVSGF